MNRSLCLLFTLLALAAAVAGGCASGPKPMAGPSLSGSHPPGTIISADLKAPVSFEQMIADLAKARVVYVGETHTRARDHEIQLRILEALQRTHPDLCVGMEMFSRPYQARLDQWSEGGLETAAFIRRVHWYANWKFDYGLYADLLAFIRDHRLPLYGLNIAFHVPPKIAAGGIDSLLPVDAERLPRQINFSEPAHRKYLREIFDAPHHSRRHITFEHFYQAQCVWEEVMAETIAEKRRNRPMVVFAGNGHIIRKFGIPNRARRRTGAPFRSVMPVAADQQADPADADYLWITPAADAGAPPIAEPGANTIY